MPLKTLKKDAPDALTLQWVLLDKSYKLTLYRNRCSGCQICLLACPKEAIKAEKQPKDMGEKAKKAKIDIDLAKCNFCGICDILCPYGAIEVASTGKPVLAVVEKESFPELTRNIQLNSDKYPPSRDQSEKSCPLGLIKVAFLTSDGKPVEGSATDSMDASSGLKVEVDVDRAHCPCCGVCEVKLPSGAMRVQKFLEGKLDIRVEKCPERCTDCLDVCPITGALYLSDVDKRVHVNEKFCIYCGACKIVCPVDGALEIKRTRIHHTPVRSGAWNKALERLASPIGIAKELKTKGSLKARESARKRIGLKEE